ncbi:YdeI/OmpD-associated family protein [Isoptericola sp. NPDC057191]|uniref:YdeI/OmpD-associated family protein n=1 Tax=Isoptericola sp. NPDC057191 TaxID=3346041 RepID=UPI00363A022D
MRFRSVVEPAEKMQGLEVPPQVVEALGGGARPPVVITVNGHSWRSRVAIMRGRHLLGLSRANREAAGLEVGAEVEVELTLDTEPRDVVEPEELARALDADPLARTAYDALPAGRRRRYVLDVEGAKQDTTRARRIEKVLAELHG